MKLSIIIEEKAIVETIICDCIISQLEYVVFFVEGLKCMFQKFQFDLVYYSKHIAEVVLHIWLHYLNRYAIDHHLAFYN